MEKEDIKVGEMVTKGHIQYSPFFRNVHSQRLGRIRTGVVVTCSGNGMES